MTAELREQTAKLVQIIPACAAGAAGGRRQEEIGYGE
ncbi:MAG: hypothetical protein DDT32_00932 [Syntrophomonadaceae bacterium]|nr:hypothetical protein [Bacillota bacterium]MBT9147180.1 hypothetical protein [Bacillota bacterium]